MQSKTSHFYFFYNKDTLAATEINIIEKKEEEAFESVSNFLAIGFNKKIRFNLFSSPIEILRRTGFLSNGIAYPVRRTIYAVYSIKVKALGKHEITHILAYKIGNPPLFLQEGIAVSLDKNWLNKPLFSYFDKTLWTYKKLRIEQIFKEFNSLFLNPNRIKETSKDLLYPVSGLFVEFLINEFGIEKFKDLYRILSFNATADDFKENICKVYNTDLNEIELNWLENMSRSNVI